MARTLKFYLAIAFAICAGYYVSLPILLCFGLLIAFFLSEKWWWHKNPSIEERLLGLWSAIFSSVILFYDDTWIYFLRPYRSWLTDFLVVAFSYLTTRRLVFHYEQSRIKGHSAGASFRTAYMKVFFPKHKRQYRPKQEAALILSHTLDYMGTLNSAMPDLQRPFRGNKLSSMENNIIEGLSKLSNEDLSDVVSQINMGALLYNVRNRTHFFAETTNNKTRLLRLLCVERVAALDAPARAAVLNGMQAGGVFRLMGDEATAYAANVLQKTFGEDLFMVKNLLDSSGNYNNLHKLIYIDFTSDEERGGVLRHIAREARQYLSHRRTSILNHSGTPKNHLKTVRTINNLAELRSLPPEDDDDDGVADSPETPAEDSIQRVDSYRRLSRDSGKSTKILSDVDDTLMSSGGDNIAGVDTRLPAKCVYPGVLEFYKQLDLGPEDDTGVWPEDQCGNLTFLSARPHIYKDATESATFAMLAQLRETKGLYCTPTLLSGSLGQIKGFRASGTAIYLKDYAVIRDKKIQNLTEYRTLYPEYKLLLVGDNGQGDVMVAESALMSGNLACAFIHQVLPIEQTYGYSPGAAERWASLRIHFFGTYIGAAVQAHEWGLLSMTGARRVIACAVEDAKAMLDDARRKPNWWFPSSKERWIKSFNDDMARASSLLPISAEPIILAPEDLLVSPTLVSQVTKSATDMTRRLSGTMSPGFSRLSKGVSTLGAAISRTSSTGSTKSTTHFKDNPVVIGSAATGTELALAARPTLPQSEDGIDHAIAVHVSAVGDSPVKSDASGGSAQQVDSTQNKASDEDERTVRALDALSKRDSSESDADREVQPFTPENWHGETDPPDLIQSDAGRQPFTPENWHGERDPPDQVDEEANEIGALGNSSIANRHRAYHVKSSKRTLMASSKSAL